MTSQKHRLLANPYSNSPAPETITIDGRSYRAVKTETGEECQRCAFNGSPISGECLEAYEKGGPCFPPFRSGDHAIHWELNEDISLTKLVITQEQLEAVVALHSGQCRTRQCCTCSQSNVILNGEVLACRLDSLTRKDLAVLGLRLIEALKPFGKTVCGPRYPLTSASGEAVVGVELDGELPCVGDFNTARDLLRELKVLA